MEMHWTPNPGFAGSIPVPPAQILSPLYKRKIMGEIADMDLENPNIFQEIDYEDDYPQSMISMFFGKFLKRKEKKYIWTTKEGEQIPITEMTSQHLQNTINMLTKQQRNADSSVRFNTIQLLKKELKRKW